MSRPLKTILTDTSGTPASFLPQKIRYRANDFPYQVKVEHVWHTEIVIAMQDWIKSYGGTDGIDYIATQMTEYFFRDIAFAMLFVIRFNGVDSETLVTR